MSTPSWFGLRDQVTRFCWVRHAPVTEDGGCIYGQADLPCNTSATPVFEGVARLVPFDALWVTSHLQRTVQTADAVHLAAKRSAPAYVTEPRFAEQDFGAWQGVKRTEFFAARAHDPHRFWYCPADECPPGGESFVAVVDRVRAGVENLLTHHAGKDIVVVAHGGTIRAALCIALDIDPEASLAFSTENCSITRLDFLGGMQSRYRWRVMGVNDQPWKVNGSGASVLA